MDYTAKELMVVCAARQIQDGERVFVGMRLPLIAFALAKRTHAPNCVGLFESGTLRDTPAEQLLYTMGDAPNITDSLWATSTVNVIGLMATEDQVTGPINMGNPNEFSIRELAEVVLELTGSRSRLIDKPLPADDPKQRQPDITQARAELRWEPQIQLREGLTKTIRYFDELLGSGATLEFANPVGAMVQQLKQAV